MKFGKGFIKTLKGEEELKSAFWKILLPLSAVIAPALYYLALPMLGAVKSMLMAVAWAFIFFYGLKKCWCNSTSAFQEEFERLARFLGAVWMVVMLILVPLYFLVYR